ncbi:MAG: serine hydrolase domain-containing protein [Pseudomonadota bacterium]
MILATLSALAASSLSVGTLACPDIPERLRAGTSTAPAVSGLQIAILKDGAVVCSRAAGAAQWTADGAMVPLTTEHTMRVASISKLAVALGVMRLVEDGKLDLDADLARTLGFPLRNPAFPDEPITLRRVLSHTSSVRDGKRYWLDASETLADFFTPGTERYEGGAHFSVEPGEDPGTYFNYSNLNFSLAAAAIEMASGQRFDVFLETNVLKPLGIDGASFNPCRTVAHGRPLATLYRKRRGEDAWDPGGPWIPQVDADELTCAVGLPAVSRSDPNLGADPLTDYPLGSNPTYFSPQGGLRASAEDIAQLLTALRRCDNPLLTTATAETMLATQWQLNADNTNGTTTEFNDDQGSFDGLMTRYGLSVHWIDLNRWNQGPETPVLAGHLGDAYGLLGMALIDPDTGDGFVALITGTSDDPAKNPTGRTPLYRIEEDILTWILETFSQP